MDRLCGEWCVYKNTEIPDDKETLNDETKLCWLYLGRVRVKIRSIQISLRTWGLNINCFYLYMHILYPLHILLLLSYH